MILNENEINSSMKDIELLRIYNEPNVSLAKKNKVLSILWERYQPQIHKNWWKLQRQMNNLDTVNMMKDDYYDEATEAFLVAISKIDLSRVENDNFKCVGMLNWYLTNVRTKIIKKIKKLPPTKSLSYMNSIDSDTNKVDSDVEESYWDNEGFMNDPSYALEKKIKDELYNKVISECQKKWGRIENIIFRELIDGKKKSEISKELDLSDKNIRIAVNRIKTDLKMMYKSLN